MRDEITRRALENADIYIVVLTARQALSSADVALLRILRGLHKERITVFINRIDELGDLVRDVPAIVKHVQAGLRPRVPDLGDSGRGGQRASGRRPPSAAAARRPIGR